MLVGLSSEDPSVGSAVFKEPLEDDAVFETESEPELVADPPLMLEPEGEAVGVADAALEAEED